MLLVQRKEKNPSSYAHSFSESSQKKKSSLMSRFTSLDSPDKNLKENMGYSNDFQAMLEGLEDEDSMEVINCSGKKRRLNIDQVQALERIFEVDNKLDPERKVKLAQELGLQPRQVAIWFQNRRARWKTKQLERDYHLLKANYDALQLSYTKVEQEKENLVAELRGLKEKFGEESHPNQETKDSIGTSLQSSPNNNVSDHHHHQKYNDSSELGLMYKNHHQEGKGMLEFKEGFSDSDSSGVLNNEDGNNPMISKLISSSSYNPTFLDQSAAFSLSAAPVYHPHLLDSKDNYHQQQSLNQFTVDESCNFFSQLDQAPPFWYISDPRNQ